LRARYREDGAFGVLELSGEADIATFGLLRQELAQLAATSCAGAVLDVTRLTFCDVASAYMIQAAQLTMPLTVLGAKGSVKRVFDLLDAVRVQRLPQYLGGHGDRNRAVGSRSWAS
jgi:anti-anti-sigma regulatory factor